MSQVVAIDPDVTLWNQNMLRRGSVLSHWVDTYDVAGKTNDSFDRDAQRVQWRLECDQLPASERDGIAADRPTLLPDEVPFHGQSGKHRGPVGLQAQLSR